MLKKISLKCIKENFEREGYILLSKEFINNKQKLEYICKNRHRHSISWSNWQQGIRCPYCSKYRNRCTIEFIRSEFAKEGYELLTTEYKNNKQKLDYVCPKGHRHGICWNSWISKRRCPYCARNGKPTIEFIKSEFAKEDYELLTTKYKNNSQKLEYICSNGHKHSISWHGWQFGYRCPMCRAINMSGSNHPMWKGGIACEPYCPIWINKEFRQMILERDNYQCQNPDCWGTSEKICGHHIDYDKKNCNPFNIITVCNSCNGRANKNREYWTNFYQKVMSKKYGYVYGKQKAFFG